MTDIQIGKLSKFGETVVTKTTTSRRQTMPSESFWKLNTPNATVPKDSYHLAFANTLHNVIYF